MKWFWDRMGATDGTTPSSITHTHKSHPHIFTLRLLYPWSIHGEELRRNFPCLALRAKLLISGRIQLYIGRSWNVSVTWFWQTSVSDKSDFTDEGYVYIMKTDGKIEQPDFQTTGGVKSSLCDNHICFSTLKILSSSDLLSVICSLSLRGSLRKNVSPSTRTREKFTHNLFQLEFRCTYKHIEFLKCVTLTQRFNCSFLSSSVIRVVLHCTPANTLVTIIH